MLTANVISVKLSVELERAETSTPVFLMGSVIGKTFHVNKQW